jgi:hypothetical protein
VKSKEQPEKRKAERYRVQAPARYFAAGAEGSGSITELSKQGVGIEGATLRVNVGDRIRISFSLMRTSVPILVPARVTRVWEHGLAADFGELDPRNRNSLRLALAQLRRRHLEDDETGLTILRGQGRRRRD